MHPRLLTKQLSKGRRLLSIGQQTRRQQKMGDDQQAEQGSSPPLPLSQASGIPSPSTVPPSSSISAQPPFTSPPTASQQTPTSPQLALHDPINGANFQPIFHSMIPSLDEGLHKGSAGRIGIIGGSRFYCGAPYYAAMSALRLGGDLVYVISTKVASVPIKNYSPELIVCPVLDTHDALIEIAQLLPKIHSLVIGPGLGKEGDVYKVVIKTVEMAKEQKIPIVFDADAMFLITRCPDMVRGYKRAMITPNSKEFDYLASKMGLPLVNSSAGEMALRDAVRAMAIKMEGVVVIRKGQTDIISDGNSTVVCNMPGAPRRCGGQGDVLAGACGLYAHWSTMALARQRPMNPGITPFLLAGYSACAVTRAGANLTYKQTGRSMLTTDILTHLGGVYKFLNVGQRDY